MTFSSSRPLAIKATISLLIAVTLVATCSNSTRSNNSVSSLRGSNKRRLQMMSSGVPMGFMQFVESNTGVVTPAPAPAVADMEDSATAALNDMPDPIEMPSTEGTATTVDMPTVTVTSVAMPDVETVDSAGNIPMPVVDDPVVDPERSSEAAAPEQTKKSSRPQKQGRDTPTVTETLAVVDSTEPITTTTTANLDPELYVLSSGVKKNGGAGAIASGVAGKNKPADLVLTMNNSNPAASGIAQQVVPTVSVDYAPVILNQLEMNPVVVGDETAQNLESVENSFSSGPDGLAPMDNFVSFTLEQP